MIAHSKTSWRSQVVPIPNLPQCTSFPHRKVSPILGYRYTRVINRVFGKSIDVFISRALVLSAFHWIQIIVMYKTHTPTQHTRSLSCVPISSPRNSDVEKLYKHEDYFVSGEEIILIETEICACIKIKFTSSSRLARCII